MRLINLNDDNKRKTTTEIVYSKKTKTFETEYPASTSAVPVSICNTACTVALDGIQFQVENHRLEPLKERERVHAGHQIVAIFPC